MCPGNAKPIAVRALWSLVALVAAAGFGCILLPVLLMAAALWVTAMVAAMPVIALGWLTALAWERLGWA